VVSVPAFLLRRLYVKGSLHNRADGWGFRLKNGLGSGYAKGMLPLSLDKAEVPMEKSFFATEDVMAHVPIPDDLRSNIEFAYYPAGHMMYIHEPSRRQQSSDLAAFIGRASPPR